MQKQTLSESNFDLWLLIGRVNHEIMLARQKELRKYNIPIQQTLFLYTLQSLGPKATISRSRKSDGANTRGNSTTCRQNGKLWADKENKKLAKIQSFKIGVD